MVWAWWVGMVWVGIVVCIHEWSMVRACGVGVVWVLWMGGIGSCGVYNTCNPSPF